MLLRGGHGHAKFTIMTVGLISSCFIFGWGVVVHVGVVCKEKVQDIERMQNGKVIMMATTRTSDVISHLRAYQWTQNTHNEQEKAEKPTGHDRSEFFHDQHAASDHRIETSVHWLICSTYQVSVPGCSRLRLAQ